MEGSVKSVFGRKTKSSPQYYANKDVLSIKRLQINERGKTGIYALYLDRKILAKLQDNIFLPGLRPSSRGIISDFMIVQNNDGQRRLRLSFILRDPQRDINRVDYYSYKFYDEDNEEEFSLQKKIFSKEKPSTEEDLEKA